MGPTSTRTSSARVLVVLGLGLLLLTGVGVVRGQGVEAEPGKEPVKEPGKILGDAKCFLCHQDHKASFPKSIHGALGGEEDSTSCEVCHGAGEQHVLSGGEVEFIVRYGELDATASSKRCLSCHGRTAEKGGHIDGFLESRWLAKGLGCNSCHQAHTPLMAAVPAEEPTVGKTVGEATCLVCHSDYKEYGHRPHVADALGCETCHGAGRAHAESRGDPSLIRHPDNLQSPGSDRSCLMCHGDKTAPEHFKPEPGKNRCVDCHSIHVAEEASEAPADQTPGAPAFRMGDGEEVPDPTGAGNAFRLPPLPAEPGEGGTWAGVKGSGNVRFGGRWTNIVGNEDVYDQDVNLDSGVRLFDFDLSAALENSPETKLRLSGAGTGDPVQNYLLDFRREDSWALTAKFSRTESSYAATGDPRDWKATRKNFAADLTVLLGADFRLTIGLDVQDREGEFAGTVTAAGQTINGSEPFDESGTYGYVRLDWGNGPLLLSLTQGLRREEFKDEVSAGQLAVPTDRSLESERETDVTGPMTTFLAEWKVSRELTLDGKLIWATFDSDTTYESVTTGPGGGAGLVDTTEGEVDGEKSHLRGEIGATWVPMDDWTILARLEGNHTTRDSEGRFRTEREEPPAAPPVTTNRNEAETSEHRRLRARGEAHWQVNDWLGVLGGVEYVKEEYEYEVNGAESDHDSSIAGPILGFDLAPAKGLDVDFLYRFTKVSDPFTEIGPKDVDNARLRARWQATDEWRFTGRARRSLLTNPRHETSVLTWGAGVGVLWLPFEELEVDASWDYQHYDSETEVVRYVGGVASLELSEYLAQTRGGHLGVLWRVTPEFRLRARLSNVYTTGDYETGWLDVVLGGEYDLQKEITLGLDARYVRYDESDFDADDYAAYILEFWLRMGI